MIARELLGAGLPVSAINALSGSRSTAVTAAGGTQATATALNSSINIVTTCAIGANGVILPSFDVADTITVVNATAANLSVYPPVGGAISGASTNIPLTMAPNTKVEFLQTTSLNYAA